MKKILTTFLLFNFIILSISAQKIAFLNSKQILEATPESKKLDSTFEVTSKVLQYEFNTRIDSYRKKNNDFIKDSIAMPLSLKNIKKTELENELKNLQSFGQQAEKDLADQKQKLYEPLQKKINTIIESIVKEKGIECVFDVTVIPAIYVSQKNDITQLVIKKLTSL